MKESLGKFKSLKFENNTYTLLTSLLEIKIIPLKDTTFSWSIPLDEFNKKFKNCELCHIATEGHRTDFYLISPETFRNTLKKNSLSANLMNFEFGIKSETDEGEIDDWDLEWATLSREDDKCQDGYCSIEVNRFTPLKARARKTPSKKSIKTPKSSSGKTSKNVARSQTKKIRGKELT